MSTPADDKNNAEKDEIKLKSSDSSKYKQCHVCMNMHNRYMRTLYELATRLSSQPEDKLLLANFSARFKDITAWRDKFVDAVTYLAAHCADEDEQKEIDITFATFNDMYYSVQVIQDSLLNVNKPTVSQPSSCFGSNNNNQLCLPKISIQPFTGNYTEWPSFIALFDSLVHQVQDISNVRKMHYLVSFLDKEPKNLIKHLEISSDNYLKAYDMLKERYENKRLIADKHLELILSLGSINQNNLNNNLRKFVNTLKENLQALTALKFDVDSWSFVLLHIVVRKLPIDLRSRFELDHCTLPNSIPSFSDLLRFLEAHLRVLEAVSNNCKGHTLSSTSQNNQSKVLAVSGSTPRCSSCNGEHNLYNCDKFNSMTTAQRREFVKTSRLCYNCLRNHSVNNCASKSSCQVCGGRHHTKLHMEHNVSTSQSTGQPMTSTPSRNESAVSNVGSTVQSLHAHSIHGGSTMLLGTALVGVQDVDGHTHRVRAMLDSGSQVTIITEGLAQMLRLPRSTSGTLYGLGGCSGQRTNGLITCCIKAITDCSQAPLVTSAVILKRIMGDLPCVQVSSSVLNKCQGISLADSEFNTPGPIDLLIGVDLYDQIFDGRKLHLGEGFPTAFGSIFGWVLMGRAPMDSTFSSNFSGLATLSCTADLDSILMKFWEVEQVPVHHVQDPEDVQCEKHFMETHGRDDTGRFIVRLPFKTEHKPLGETHTKALTRFHNLERKLLKFPRLRELYIAFMQDYLDAGHMQLISCVPSQNRYYIPHHGVLKESSSTTKLRAVFDASAPSSSGMSLNQVLLAGPKLQQNVEDVILRFRTHAIAFICDVKQMYRQVRMHEEDAKYQTIFWRESPDLPLQQFELTTVTYGVTSAAYLAMRIILELALLSKDSHPEAARILSEDIFVDDIISGGSDVPSVKVLQQQIVSVLAQGGFQLRKWASNSKEILQDFPKDHLETPFRFEESGDNIFKVLGIVWNAEIDSFVYRVSNFGKCTTKREILSNIARIYDPCGFLAPITFYAKVVMQRLWSYELGWDDPLPEDFQSIWKTFVEGFGVLGQSQVPRFILCENLQRCDLIGFCDASEAGYAAVTYLRVVDLSGQVHIHLLLAKSRVAPIKQKWTVPRLELSGALLLSKLLAHVTDVLGKNITISETIAWSDSKIVLAWLRMSPHKLQTFEGNRVSQISGLVPSAQWRHVPSALNPADCASRGLQPAELVNHPLWWCPKWLTDEPQSWPSDDQVLANENLPGIKPSQSLSPQYVNSSSLASTSPNLIITRFSSLSRLQRISAWLLRFSHNARNPSNRLTGTLSVQELENSLHTIIRLVQTEVFADSIEAIRKGRKLKGSISSLSPYLDKKRLLRIGGRLKHSSLPFDAKHPILLPKVHHFTDLVVDYYHQSNMHVGSSTLLNILRQRFWILSGRSVVRHRVYRCHRCHRLKAKTLEPFMGDLPSSRIRQARPFAKVGIDFAGPFAIKVSTVRNAKVRKAYLCLYVCLVVKAVHLEVTSDLTTESFLASFRRFTSRRGMVSEVYTDQGKNFQGAKRYINEVETFLNKEKDRINYAFVAANVKWHMNPPYAPHMGGIWESSVKSAKQLLKRTIGDQVLTFEELSTVFAQVESVLNSRPLCPLSENPDEIEVLTPGHFLVGQPLVSLPDYDFDHLPFSRLSRWQLVQQISQRFWRRWHLEYLNNLQQRAKWRNNSSNLKLGDLVLIKEDNAPPLQWRKGKVIRLHPGADQIVRVVELKTVNGNCLRSVTKLSPLPYQN